MIRFPIVGFALIGMLLLGIGCHANRIDISPTWNTIEYRVTAPVPIVTIDYLDLGQSWRAGDYNVPWRYQFSCDSTSRRLYVEAATENTYEHCYVTVSIYVNSKLWITRTDTATATQIPGNPWDCPAARIDTVWP